MRIVSVIRTVFLVSFVAIPVVDAARNHDVLGLSGLFSSRSIWESFNWESASTSSIWRNRGWVEHTGTQDLDKKVETSDAKVQLAGSTFGASIGHGVGTDETAYFASLFGKVDDCNTSIAKIAALYGAGTDARNEVDLVVKMGDQALLTVASKRVQWDVGETRITMICSKSDGASHDAESNTQVTYERVAGSKRLVAPFVLQCTGNRLMMRGQEQAMDDMAFQVDEYTGLILRPDHTGIASDAVITDSDLTYSYKGSNGTTFHYDVNRVTGALEILMTGTTGNVSARAIGKCAKFENFNPVF